MIPRIRLIISSLIMVHVLAFGISAFCQAHHGLPDYSHSSQNQGTHSLYCAWSCQAASTAPAITPAKPVLNLPNWQDHGRLALSSQKVLYRTLRFLSPRAPPV